MVVQSLGASSLEDADETNDHHRLDEWSRPVTRPKHLLNRSLPPPNPRKRQRVLIHCHAGISRSVTIAAAYLMQKKRQDVEEALQLIKRARPIAQPNEGFLAQLQLWWDVRFRLYHLPEFLVPCEEYRELKRRLGLKG